MGLNLICPGSLWVSGAVLVGCKLHYFQPIGTLPVNMPELGRFWHIMACLHGITRSSSQTPAKSMFKQKCKDPRSIVKLTYNFFLKKVLQMSSNGAARLTDKSASSPRPLCLTICHTQLVRVKCLARFLSNRIMVYAKIWVNSKLF